MDETEPTLIELLDCLRERTDAYRKYEARVRELRRDLEAAEFKMVTAKRFLDAAEYNTMTRIRAD